MFCILIPSALYEKPLFMAQRMERLRKAHRGVAGPAEAALCGSLKIKSKVAKVIGRIRPSVSSPIWNGVRESGTVGGCEAVKHHRTLPSRVSTSIMSHRLGWVALSVIRLSSGGVEATSDPSKVSGSNQSVKGRIDRRVRFDIGKIFRGPDSGLRLSGDAFSVGQKRWAGNNTPVILRVI